MGNLRHEQIERPGLARERAPAAVALALTIALLGACSRRRRDLTGSAGPPGSRDTRGVSRRSHLDPGWLQRTRLAITMPAW